MKNHCNPRVALCKVIPIKESGKGLLVESEFSLWNPESKGTVIIIAWGWGGGEFSRSPL